MPIRDFELASVYTYIPTPPNAGNVAANAFGGVGVHAYDKRRKQKMPQLPTALCAAERCSGAAAVCRDHHHHLYNIRVQCEYVYNTENIAVKVFTLEHPSANVRVDNFKLSVKAMGSELVVKSLNIPKILVTLKEQAQSQQSQTASTAITQLPALPNIEFTSPLDITIEQFDIDKVAIKQGEQDYEIENIALQMSMQM